MFSQLVLQLIFVEIFMDNILISFNYLKKADKFQIKIMSSLGILLIEAIIQLKQFNISFVSKLNIQEILPFLEEIMKQDNALKFMDSMKKFRENMEINVLGSSLWIYLIVCHFLHWLKEEFYVFMEVYLLTLEQLTKFE